MKEKYFLNARLIDPSQNLDEVGGLIVDAKGKIKAIGKNVNAVKEGDRVLSFSSHRSSFVLKERDIKYILPNIHFCPV